MFGSLTSMKLMFVVEETNTDLLNKDGAVCLFCFFHKAPENPTAASQFS